MRATHLTNLLVFAIANNFPVLIKGMPGVGKSDIVEQACKLAGADLIISHPVVSDPTDYKGLPFVVNGKAVFLPIGDLETLMNATQKIVYLLDDLGQAPPSVQAACFPSGTLVRTFNGEIPIENIREGDYVLSDDGKFHKVYEKHVRNYSGNMHTIKATNLLELKVTDEHPILVIEKRKPIYAKSGDGYDRTGEKVSEQVWKAAKDISIGDWVAIPIPQQLGDAKKVLIARDGDMEYHMNISKEFARFMGWYVGDGCYVQHKDVQSVQIFIDKSDDTGNADMDLIMNTVFGTKRTTKGLRGNVMRHSVHDKYLGTFMENVCGRYAANKRIPKFILYNTDKTLLVEFLKGLLFADGTIRRYNKTRVNGVSYTTISRELALDLQLAFARLGIVAHIKYKCRAGDVMVNPKTGKESKVKDSYSIQVSESNVLDLMGIKYTPKNRDCKYYFEHDNKLWVKVTENSIKTVENTLVYNIEVEETHTYTANNMIVHNCMQLILARRINGHKVSDNVVFVACTNRREDKAGVGGLLEPVKSRFYSIVELEVNTDDWVKWALSHNMPNELISFIQWRPELLCNFKPTKDLINSPCPRTVAAVGKMQSKGIPNDLFFDVIKGAVGEEFAVEYQAFIKLYMNLPTVNSIILDPDNAMLPTDPASQYALTGALSDKMTPQNIGAIMIYLARMQAEMSVATMKKVATTKPQLCATREFIAWASDNAGVIL